MAGIPELLVRINEINATEWHLNDIIDDKYPGDEWESIKSKPEVIERRHDFAVAHRDLVEFVMANHQDLLVNIQKDIIPPAPPKKPQPGETRVQCRYDPDVVTYVSLDLSGQALLAKALRHFSRKFSVPQSLVEIMGNPMPDPNEVWLNKGFLP